MKVCVLRCRCVALLFLVTLALPAAAHRYKAKGFTAKSIDSMVAVRPELRVGLIREGDDLIFSDSFTRVCMEAHTAILHRYAGEIKLRGILGTSDKSLDGAFSTEIQSLFSNARQRKFERQASSAPKIDSAVAAMGMRYVLLVEAVGFTRTKANYRKEDLKSVGPALLSLGLYMRVPVREMSEMRVLILDRQTRDIVYFNDVNGASAMQDPSTEGSLASQFRALFYYFFPLSRD